SSGRSATRSESRPSQAASCSTNCNGRSVACRKPSPNAASSCDVARMIGTPCASREISTGARNPRSVSVSAMLERQCYHAGMRKMLALLLVMGSCGDDSAAPGGFDAPIVPDAPSFTDGSMTTDGSGMVDAHFIDGPCDERDGGVCCSRRRIYLNFDGVDLVA